MSSASELLRLGRTSGALLAAKEALQTAYTYIDKSDATEVHDLMTKVTNLQAKVDRHCLAVQHDLDSWERR